MVCFIAASALSGYFFTRAERTYTPPPLTEADLCISGFAEASKLMIVAHPDDETIWGGAHLLDGGYLVLCLTNGSDPQRADEFRRAVIQSGNVPLILSYPDKTNFRRNNWIYAEKGIENDIRFVMSAKEWDFVVTHNPQGEYGHIHHKLTSAVTVKVFEDTDSAGRLFFFGDYYKASEMQTAKGLPEPIPAEKLDRKAELCGIYISQKRVMLNLSHMFPYEDWKEYVR